MIVFLIINIIMVVNCLDPKVQNDINNDIKTIMGKYLSKIPDVEPRYVLNDKLSSIINHYFKGKISALPLYKISLKIDRNPVKIPWTLSAVDEPQGDIVLQRAQSIEQEDSFENIRHYKVMKVSANRTSTEKPVKTAKPSNTATKEAPLVEIQ